MPIPLAYNLRNLARRRVTTLMTSLGVALAVAVLVSVLALLQGLRTSFEATGDPRDLLVLRKGSTAELVSVISRTTYQDIRAQPGIARSPGGEPLISLEVVSVVNFDDNVSGKDMNFNLRGLTAAGLLLRPKLRMLRGRMFEPGQREVVVGRSIAERFPEVRPGATVVFGRGSWRIAGVFEAGRTLFNGEVWGDLNQIAADFNRSDALSSIVLRPEPGGLAAMARSLEADPRFTVMAIPERQYYEDQTSTARPVQFMGAIVAAVLAAGSAFAAMNTMFAAVARRASEIGTLRVLGFSRAAILASFLVESLVLALIGGAAGCLLALPLNRVNTDIGSYSSFSTLTFNFHVSAPVLAAGLLFALAIGAVGGLLPASRAARLEILPALRMR